MRRSFSVLATLAVMTGAVITGTVMTGVAVAQAPKEEGKKNANPCRDEVDASLKKLRNSSWFRMESTMVTENGLTNMTIDYVLPDRMHQKVNVIGQPVVQEVILVGNKAWSNEGDGWRVLPADITTQLVNQMQDSVLTPQEDVGNYSCKGRVKLDGKDVMSYKLEDEAPENAPRSQNEAYRMFYVDAMTGLPIRNAILTPGREEKPIFKTNYSFPLDLKVEPPKDAKPLEAPHAAGAPATQTTPTEAAPATQTPAEAVQTSPMPADAPSASPPPSTEAPKTP